MLTPLRFAQSESSRARVHAAMRGAAGSRSGDDASAEADARSAANADLLMVQSTRRGDRAALDSFVRRMCCVPAILAAQNKRFGRPLDSAELEDLVQDSLLVIWRKLDSYSGGRTIEAWVYRICHLELLNHVRKKRRFRFMLQTLRQCFAAPERRSLVSLLEESEHLHRGLDRLGAPEADVIRLKHFEALTFEEVGRRLGIPANTAKTQYYRGLDRLQELLTTGRGDTSG